MNTWWYIHTATLYKLFCRWTRDNIYMSELYINFPADEHVMRYIYRDFRWTFLEMNTWQCMYTANFISTFLQMSTWWYIHTATFYRLSCARTRDDIYIPELYIFCSADEHVVTYTYCNFISTFPPMNTWRYMETATLYLRSWKWTHGNIYMLQLLSTFLQMNTWWYIHTETW